LYSPVDEPEDVVVRAGEGWEELKEGTTARPGPEEPVGEPKDKPERLAQSSRSSVDGQEADMAQG
jgi:hypothetical protein